MNTLTTDGIPEELSRQGTAVLDLLWPNKSRQFVRTRVSAWIGRFLDYRFGHKPPRPPIDPREAALRRDQAARRAFIARLEREAAARPALQQSQAIQGVWFGPTVPTHTRNYCEEKLGTVPRSIRSFWSGRGARLEVIDSDNVQSHPEFSDHQDPFMRKTIGIACGELAVVPTRAPGPGVDFPLVHEMGHQLAYLLDRADDGKAWLECWKSDKQNPCIGTQSTAVEHWAEAFTDFCSPAPVTMGHWTRLYFERVERFCANPRGRFDDFRG